MSNLSSAGSNSPKHTSSSSKYAPGSPSNNIPLLPPSPVHPPLPFLIFPLPPQVFIPEEVHPLDWSKYEGEDFEELWLQAKEEAEEAEYNAFMASLSMCRRRCRPTQSGSESSTLSLFDSEKSNSFNRIMKERTRRKKRRTKRIRRR